MSAWKIDALTTTRSSTYSSAAASAEVAGAPKDEEEDEEFPDRREDMSRLHSFMAKGWPCIGLQLWAREPDGVGGAGPPQRAAFLPFPFLAAWQPGASSTRINKNITQFLMRTTLSVNLLANR